MSEIKDDFNAQLFECLEILADWVDQTPVDDAIICGDFFNAIWQIIELTQMLYTEHNRVLAYVNDLVGAVQLQMEEQAKAKSATQLIVANAQEMKRYIQE